MSSSNDKKERARSPNEQKLRSVGKTLTLPTLQIWPSEEDDKHEPLSEPQSSVDSACGSSFSENISPNPAAVHHTPTSPRHPARVVPTMSLPEKNNLLKPFRTNSSGGKEPRSGHGARRGSINKTSLSADSQASVEDPIVPDNGLLLSQRLSISSFDGDKHRLSVSSIDQDYDNKHRLSVTSIDGGRARGIVRQHSFNDERRANHRSISQNSFQSEIDSGITVRAESAQSLSTDDNSRRSSCFSTQDERAGQSSREEGGPARPSNINISCSYQDNKPTLQCKLTMTSRRFSTASRRSFFSERSFSKLSRKRSSTDGYDLSENGSIYSPTYSPPRSHRPSYCFGETINRLTLTQTLAFPNLVPGQLNTYKRRDPHRDTDAKLNRFAKIITGLVLVLVLILVFSVIYRFIKESESSSNKSTANESPKDKS